MGKRIADGDAASEHTHAKRQKTQAVSPPEEIHSARQLQALLTFRQDDPEALAAGIASFKAFLDNILYIKDDQHHGTQLAILRDFLDASRQRQRDSAVFLPDLMQAWSFAVHGTSERLSSSVSSILALLLKTISGQLDLREHGASFCRTLLQRENAKLISRGLCAESHKEAIISPCLRLLTEVVSFDGGAFAQQVFDRQDHTFNPKYLDRNLRLQRTGEDDRRRPSVRSNTVRYLLSHLRYQAAETKGRILEFRNIFRTLFDNLKTDPPEVLRDILRAIETYVLRDSRVPRRLKSVTLSDRALTSILDAARLRQEPEINGESTSERSTAISEAWKFLSKVCTVADLGILLPNGWYPPGGRGEEELDEDEDDDFPSERNGHPAEPLSVRNAILSKFLQVLRPHASLEERELFLAICTASPELVADYLQQKESKLPLDPKLTNTWIGHASFFFSIVNLPVPELFGTSSSYSSRPPPMYVVLENILPTSLSRKVMTRCLNQSSDLISLFAVRILICSLQKLQHVSAKLSAASSEHPTYLAFASRLLSEVEGRLPELAHIVAASKQISASHTVLREAYSRLSRLYAEALPGLPLGNFDVAGSITSQLSQLRTGISSIDDQVILQLELNNLLALADASSMKWFTKQASSPYTPFIMLLQSSATKFTDSEELPLHVETLLSSIAKDEGILQQSTQIPAMKALIASLHKSGDWEPADATWDFLDDCIGRLIRKPIKYLDDADGLGSADPGTDHHLSLIVLVCLEQVPFVKRLASGQQHNVLTWVSRLFASLIQIGEHARHIETVRKRLMDQGVQLPATDPDLIRLLEAAPEQNGYSSKSTAAHQKPAEHIRIPMVFLPPPKESDNHPELRRINVIDPTEAIEYGALSSLMLTLCSAYPEIRSQGLTALRSFMTKLSDENFTHEAREQSLLLLGEFLETATTHFSSTSRPLPYLLGTFAIASLTTELDPTHVCYPKVNRFLLKDPIWKPYKLIEYWLTKTILALPTEDETYWTEVDWVLDWIVDGVRTEQDVHLLVARGGMERILGLVESPGARKETREKVVQIVYRAFCAGGASMLATGCGIVGWLDTQKAMRRVGEEDVRVLVEKFEAGVNWERVDEWSRGALRAQLAVLKGKEVAERDGVKTDGHVDGEVKM